MTTRQKLALGTATLLTLTIASAAMALFTDTAVVPENQVAAATLDISTQPAAAVTAAHMVPGDSVVETLTVSNDGSVELRYSMSTTITGDTMLADQLQLTIKGGLTNCTEAAMTDGASGTVIYQGSLSMAGFGDATAGQQTGDRVLSPAGDEALCLRLLMPLDTSNEYQGKTTTATFNFSAEQTANNA